MTNMAESSQDRSVLHLPFTNYPPTIGKQEHSYRMHQQAMI